MAEINEWNEEKKTIWKLEGIIEISPEPPPQIQTVISMNRECTAFETMIMNI